MIVQAFVLLVWASIPNENIQFLEPWCKCLTLCSWPQSKRTYTEQEAYIVCRRIGSKKAVLWQFVSFELARVGYKKWLFEAKNGTQRAKIQKTNCKIGAMHHSTTAQWFSTSDSVVYSYGDPQPSTPQCPRPLAGQRHQVRVLPIASNHGCTFPAPIFMVHQFI